MSFQPHIHPYKKQQVEEIKQLLEEYPVVGVVNLEGLPARMLQRIKKKLRNEMVLKYTRKHFMRIAFEQSSKKNVANLKNNLEGIPALLFTKQDPFALARALEKSKTSAPAKPGQKAPSDLSIPAGPTPFTPGPMIGELGQLGIKTEVKEGKISIREDKVLVHEGEEIKPKVAELLAKLGIEPMKLGLNLVVAYENGEILPKNVLVIDEEQYKSNIKMAYSQSLALAMHLGIVNAETVKPLVQKAFREGKALAEKADFITPETAGKKLAEAERAAESIQSSMPELPAASAPEPESQQVAKEEIKEEPMQNTKPYAENLQPKKEHKQEAAVEMKKPFGESDMAAAEKFLKDLSEKTVKVAGSQRIIPQQQGSRDINSLINELKDRKIAQDSKISGGK